MKILLIILLVLSFQTIADAKVKDSKTDPSSYFLKVEEVVDAMFLLPEPPMPGSAEFQFDEAMYQYGMTMRNKESGIVAAQDAIYSTKQIIMSFSKAFEFTISQDMTPAIFALSFKVMKDAGGLATHDIKKAYSRLRPFVYYETDTCNPNGQTFIKPNRSYPSGHSTAGWALALVLSEINPKRQNEILQRGLEIGQGRVICGYHWQSDVQAGRILAAAVVARLHTIDRFIKELADAKEEFARLKASKKVNN